ncbi:hypothetical protein HU200_045279 [Digitaria exilis]|uniref:rRNA N-glycosylase n=1 Tax=Digitaria exilis TaxID=1010633 RepID=A0A835EFT7_9POAL|nr:hypothetical protein HU200_045279 [Digitaria exilis]
MGDSTPSLAFGGHTCLSSKDADAGQKSSPAAPRRTASRWRSQTPTPLGSGTPSRGSSSCSSTPPRTLPFNASYYHLIGGHRNLPMVPLGRSSALQAIQELSRPGTATPKPDSKAALVRLMSHDHDVGITAVEGDPRGIQREMGERELRHQGASRTRAALGGPVVPRVAMGGDWCVGRRKQGTKPHEKIGFYNGAQALSMVDLIKRPKELCVRDGHVRPYILLKKMEKRKTMMRALSRRKLAKEARRRRPCTETSDGTSVSMDLR